MSYDWLADFSHYASFGEASPRAMWWVGVSALAGALRRKVWFDQDIFQWSPNFYILLVGPPGAIKKSTSIDIGMNILDQVGGINRGPSTVTWQALIEYIANIKELVVLNNGQDYEMSSVTLALSEFGTLFKSDDADMIVQLTDLWDGKKGKSVKMTKTAGTDIMTNPWVNLIAATTPQWLAKNFSSDLVGGGLAGRFIFLNEKMSDIDRPYPKRCMGNMAERRAQERRLVEMLTTIASYAGEFDLTEEAYEWGTEWYLKERAQLRILGTDSLESGFIVRKQVHLHKLAMIISAAKLQFPVVSLENMLEAEKHLLALDADTRKVFGYVGQSKQTSAAREIVEYLVRNGTVEKRELYRTHFFRTMTSEEYDQAINSAVNAELIMIQDGVAKPLLMLR